MQDCSWYNVEGRVSVALIYFIIFLVDFDNEIRQASPPSSSDWCRKNEVYFKKACYHFSKDVDESVSQEFAHRNACQQLYDADLASLSSISEYFFIAKEFSPSKSAYWIGLIRNDTSDSFTWLLGSYPTFTKWAKYEPTHGKGDCVTFGFDGLDFGWSVANCSAKAGYICKSTNGYKQSLFMYMFI